ncbi:MFS transporter [Candidatus Bathyarchaeota archaeon]|nr:MFS transporter [Candidatus Bathyarchaeota archaeon]
MKKDTLDLLLLGVAHSLNHSLFLVLPPLLDNITADLGASFGTMGLIGTLTFLTYGSGALIGGPLSDRLGSLKVARISIGLGGVMTVLFLFADSVFVFGAGMFLMALWASFYHPTANGLIAKAFTENTGGAMGTHNAAGNLGQVLTPTVAYYLGVTFNWRLSFVFFGALSVATAAFLSRIEVDEGEVSGESQSYLEFIKTPGLWMILLYNVFVGFLFRSVDLFFPSFLSAEKGYTGGLAAVANSGILLLGVAGQLLGGMGSDRLGQTKTLLIASAGMALSLVLLMVLPTGTLGVALFILLYGVSMFGHQPTVTSMVSRLSPRHMMGLAYGVMFFSAFGVGSLSTTVTGYLADKYSLTAAFWLNAGVGVALLAVSVLIYLKIDDNATNR